MERMMTHENQITDYPKGARVESIVPISCHLGTIPAGTRGTVRDHCDDGRAWVFFDDYAAGHTFHEPEKCIRVICTHRDDNCPANHDQMSNTSDDAPAAPERGESAGDLVPASALEFAMKVDAIYDTDLSNHLLAAVRVEHNQHSTLIAQRERLIETLRSIRQTLRYAVDEKRLDLTEQALINLADLLTILEQGNQK